MRVRHTEVHRGPIPPGLGRFRWRVAGAGGRLLRRLAVAARSRSAQSGRQRSGSRSHHWATPPRPLGRGRAFAADSARRRRSRAPPRAELGLRDARSLTDERENLLPVGLPRRRARAPARTTGRAAPRALVRCRDWAKIAAIALAWRSPARSASSHRAATRCCELPEELPEGVFDLIVCADLRCYWGRRRS